MKRLFLIFIFPVLIFWKSLFAFFTNDDFYFLKISQDVTLDRFVNFFNIFTKNYDGFGVYRPIPTQIFYMLRDPMLMHLVVFVTFFGVLYFIYKLAIVLFKSERLALLSTFLYAVSATHFAHFYYLATYQEVLMTLFVLLSIATFLKKKYLYSNLFFVLGLMSKETAVVAPFLLVLFNWYSGNKFYFKRHLSYFVILGIYLSAHLFLYGLASGDSYVWDFSLRKLANSLVWYLAWSLNLPETLIDFIGPGLSVNQNLFTYWGRAIYPIFALFVVELIALIILMAIKLTDLDNRKNSLFVMLWFFASLVPVIFLPIHKFTFYLTLPLIGVVYRIAYLFKDVKNIWLYGFVTVWLFISVLTVNHSVNTSWITNSQKISKNVLNYFSTNNFNEQISLVDTENDSVLPWSPTEVVKTALSGKNFFYVYFPGLADKIEYHGKTGKEIESRQFLGY